MSTGLQLARLIVALAAAGFVVEAGKAVLLPLVLALVFLTLLGAPVLRLRRLGVPEAVGAALVLTLPLGFMAGLLALLAAPAMRWWERAPAALQGLLDAARQAGFGTPPDIPGSVPTTFQMPGLDAHAGWAFGAGAVSTVFLTFFLLLSQRWLLDATLRVLPRPRDRERVLMRISAIVDARFRLIVDDESASSRRRLGSAQALVGM